MKLIKDNAFNPYMIDEGTFTAVVELIEEKEARSKFLVWNFKVLNATFDGEPCDGDRKVSGTTPAYLKDDSKLDEWVRACGVSVEDGTELDTEDLVGKRVTVFVEHTRKKGTDKTYCQVTKIIKQATPKAKSAPKPAPAPVAEDEVEEAPPARAPKPAPKPAPKAPPAPVAEETEDPFDFEGR